MEILLLVAILAVAAAGLYVAATFNRRTQQNTTPIINDAVNHAVNDINKKIEDLRQQLSGIEGRLEQSDNRILSIAGKSFADLESIKQLGGQIGAQQDLFSRDLGQLEYRVAQLGESLAQHSAAEPQTTVLGRLYAERLRFSIVPAPGESPSPAEPWVRVQVERMVGELPTGQLGGPGDASTFTDRAEHDKAFADRLGEAASDYFAGKWGDPVSAAVAEWWRTNNSFPETAAAEVCNRISNVLKTIVEKPLEKIWTEIPLPGLGATITAGIGADLILQPLNRPVKEAREFVEITGVVVGVATGLHPLALASAKMLFSDEFHSMAARGIMSAAVDVFDGPDRQSSHERAEPTGIPTVNREPRGDRASDISRPPGLPDRNTRRPPGPGITGPGSR